MLCVSGGCLVPMGKLCVLTETEASCKQSNFNLKELFYFQAK